MAMGHHENNGDDDPATFRKCKESWFHITNFFHQCLGNIKQLVGDCT